MNERDLRRALRTLAIPGEDEAHARSDAIVRAAFAERTPARRASRRVRPLIALAVAAALVAAALSPAGGAVLDSIRDAVGVDESSPSLFALPAQGRVLVSSPEGSWIVAPDGSKRFLGTYREASWSPFGRYVVATKRDELRALEPDGDTRWSLARRNVRFPRWHGTATDTRIAYLAGSRLHVVAGDGTGDADAGGMPAAARVAPAWRPGGGYVLAFATRTHVVVCEGACAAVRLRIRWPGEPPAKLEWSSDGRRLLVLSRHRLRVFDERGHVVAQDDPSDATEDLDATFLPATHEVAVIRRAGSGSSVFLLGRARVLFRGTGTFAGLTASPDGRWLLVTWPTADQWVFVRTTGRARLRAVSSIRTQFDGTFPRVEGWCCGS